MSKLSMNILTSKRTWDGLALAVRDSSGMNSLEWRHYLSILFKRVCKVQGHPSIKMNIGEWCTLFKKVYEVWGHSFH